VWDELQHLSDSELVDAVRRGDRRAFDTLFQRHYGDACDFAASFAGPDAAPERVAEAFTRVYRALLDGRGPDTNFQAYLYSAVRNAHVDAVRRGRREIAIDDLGVELPAEDDVEDDVLTRLDASPVRRAFARLRPSWRTVLWHTAVLGESHEQVAQRMDTTPNAVAVLLFRAREGLRQAYLAEHVRDTGDKACSRVAPHLPAYVRGRLTPRRQRVVEEHVDECSRCRVAVLDLTQINDDLGAVLTPAVLLGVTGAAAGGAAALKGLLVGLVARVTDAGKGVAAAGGVAVAATAAVAVGFALTAGPDERPPRSEAPAPAPSRPGASPGDAKPPKPGKPRQRPRPDRPETAVVATTPAEPTTATATRSPSPTSPPTKPSSDPTDPTDPPSPSDDPTPTDDPPPPAPKPSIVAAAPKVVGGGLARYARVDLEVTPRTDDALVVRLSNAGTVLAFGPAVSCPAGLPSGGETVVTCTVAADHPETFPVRLHVVFQNPTQPVTGSLTLTGDQPVSQPIEIAAD